MPISALLFVRFLLNLYLRGGTAVSGTPSRKRCGSYASEGAIDGQSYKNNTIFHLGGDSCADRSACGVVAAALFALDTRFRAPRCRRFSERQVADGRLRRQAASEAVQPGDARRLLCAGLPWRHAVVRGADRCAPAKPECLYRGRDARPCGPRGRPFRSDAGQHPDEQSETDIAKNQAQGETGKEKKIPASCRRRNDPGHGFPASQVRCEASRVRRQFHGSGRAPLQSEGPRRFGRGRQRRFGDRLADAARTLRSAYPQPFDAGVRHFGNGHALRRSAADHRRVGRADGLSLFRLRHVERV